MSAEKLNIYPESERPDVSVRTLWSDNRSETADEARNVWFAARDARNLTLVEDCGDSRTIVPNPDTKANMNYIAVGEAHPEPQRNILQSPGVSSAVVVGHFDGETLLPKKMPKGCGGLAAKESQLKSQKIESNLDYYINNHLYHPDPIIQAVITAKSMWEHTEKPIMAAAQDHRTGIIYPIALFATYQDERGPIYDQAGLFARKSVVICMDKKKYDPEKIYEAGIPALEDHEVPQFAQFMKDSHETVRRLNDKIPNLYEASKVQDPVVIVESTRIMPLATWLPELGEEPGRAFGVFTSRKRINDDEIELHPEQLITSSSQMEYPIMQSLQNHDQVGKPFARTNTVLIDTENFSVSRNRASQLITESNIMREWLAIPGHKIIISKTTDGVITRIEDFDPNK